jgi:hypothetical protein
MAGGGRLVLPLLKCERSTVAAPPADSAGALTFVLLPAPKRKREQASRQ